MAQGRAQADLLRLALAAAKLDHLLHPRDGLFETRLLEVLAGLRVVRQVDGHRRRFAVAHEFRQRQMDVLGKKRREGRHGRGEFAHRGVEGREGGALVRVQPLAPEARAVQADVPVRQLADEGEQRRHHVVEAIALHLQADGLLQRLQAREQPLVEDVFGRRRVVGRPAVDFSIGLQEGEGVVPGQQGAARHVADGAVGEALFLAAHQARADEVQAQRIGAVGLHQFVRRRVVAQALGHFLAVFGEHHAVDDHVAESRLAEQGARQRHQRVEPAARLIEALGDVFGGKAGLEGGAVLERIVQLRVGHGAGLEPAVQHFLDAPVDAGLAVHRERQRIDVFAVQVVDARAGQRFEFVPGTEAADIAGLVVHPQRQRRAPDPVARDGPVRRALDPVAETPVLDVFRHPQHLFVGRFQRIAEARHAHEPGRHGAVDERLVRAVAVRIAVDEGGAVVQGAALPQAAHDVRVRLLHEAAGEVAHFRREDAAHGHRTDEGVDVRALEHAIVVFAEGRRLVNQAGAFVRRHVGVGHHDEGAAFALGLEVVEQRAIAAPHQVRALQARLHDEVGMALPIGVQPRRRQIERPLGVFVVHARVVEVRVDADGEVRGQGPRGGGPRGQARVFVFEGEEHGHRRIFDVDVVLAGLEVREHGLERRRDGHHLEAAVDEALVPELLDDPPHRLHVPDVHRLVVVVEVDPAAKPRDGAAPLGDVALDNGTAGGVVAGDAQLGDGLLGGHAEGLVDLLLDGQAVAVPAEAPLHVAALHRPVAGHDVLEHRSDEIAVVGQAGGEGRAVVEGVGLADGRLFQRTPEHVVFFPMREDAVLHLHE